MTTYQEYQVQRYEAASTLFGPNTLQAYQWQYRRLARALRDDLYVPSGFPPPDMFNKQISFNPGVMADGAPINKGFGDCVSQPPSTVLQGEVVKVK